MEVFLHLGVHKTASTFIQVQLKKNRQALLNEGICYIPLNDVRKEFVQYFNQAIRKSKDNDPNTINDLRNTLFSQVRHFSSGHDIHRLIISDENILGGLWQLANTGILYHDIARRMWLLKKVLEIDVTKVFFSIRAYDQFYWSAYAEIFRTGGYRKEFDTFLLSVKTNKNSWVRVVKELRKSLDNSNFFIWPYENFRDNSSYIISQIAGTEVSLTTLHKSVIRKSLTPQSIKVFRTCEPLLNHNEKRRFLECMAEHFYFDEKRRESDLLDNKLLQSKYEQDCRLLIDSSVFSY